MSAFRGETALQQRSEEMRALDGEAALEQRSEVLSQQMHKLLKLQPVPKASSRPTAAQAAASVGPGLLSSGAGASVGVPGAAIGRGSVHGPAPAAPSRPITAPMPGEKRPARASLTGTSASRPVSRASGEGPRRGSAPEAPRPVSRELSTAEENRRLREELVALGQPLSSLTRVGESLEEETMRLRREAMVLMLKVSFFTKTGQEAVAGGA